MSERVKWYIGRRKRKDLCPLGPSGVSIHCAPNSSERYHKSTALGAQNSLEIQDTEVLPGARTYSFGIRSPKLRTSGNVHQARPLNDSLTATFCALSLPESWQENESPTFAGRPSTQITKAGARKPYTRFLFTLRDSYIRARKYPGISKQLVPPSCIQSSSTGNLSPFI